MGWTDRVLPISKRDKFGRTFIDETTCTSRFKMVLCSRIGCASINYLNETVDGWWTINTKATDTNTLQTSSSRRFGRRLVDETVYLTRYFGSLVDDH
jgi:hypothetical protein